MHFLQLIVSIFLPVINFPEVRATPSHAYAIVMGQVLFPGSTAEAWLTSHKATGDGPAIKPELFVLLVILMICRPASHQY